MVKTPITPAPSAMPSHVGAAHADAMNNIAFGKKQQWVITNYVALIYAAIIAASGKLDRLEPWVLPALALAVGAYGVFLIYRVQTSVQKSRKRLAAINGRWFTADERTLLDLSDTPKSFFHDWPFMTGLWAAIVIGGFLTIGALVF